MIHFIFPPWHKGLLDDLVRSEVGVNYPYWMGGAVNWVTQTYMVLRQYREGLSIGVSPKPDQINIAHVAVWRKLGERGREFRVSIRADYRRLFDVDFEIVQNPTERLSGRSAYVTYWPVPGMQPRDETRQGLETIAYAGRLGERNLERALAESASIWRSLGVRFVVIDATMWHDMRYVDALIAVRNFGRKQHHNKPPSKLINAWNACIPLIAGTDSAFAAIGEPNSDYLRVRSHKELLEALGALKDSMTYERIVAQGRQKACRYSREMIAEEWLQTFDGKISNEYQKWRSSVTRLQSKRRLSQGLDRCYEVAAQFRRQVRTWR